MATDDDRRALAGIRREPPRFRRVAVRRTEPLTPRLMRVVLGSHELAGFEVGEPAASLRLLLPPPGAGKLVMPTWNGNEFLLADGTRPVLRTLTPLDLDAQARELAVEIVRHPGGAASSWAESAHPGAEAAISGPGRGYRIDPGAAGFVLAGDETALPAIGQLIRAIPEGTPVHVVVEVVGAEAKLALPAHGSLTSEWVVAGAGDPPGTALVAAIEAVAIGTGTKVWVAGEAAAMHRIRRHLFDDRGLARREVTVRGYWKHGR